MDVNTNAFRVVQVATGELRAKSATKSRAGRLGGLARAKSLPKSKQKQIAHKANRARWET
jgi:hypothetical protein